jgi:CheY-like chemotaxis protein
VVALTAYTDDSLKETCFKTGMVGFIKKPLTTEKAGYFLKKYLLDGN